MYIRKTVDEYHMQSYCCGTWETETIEETYKAAKEMLKCYRENVPNVPHRIVKKRVKIDRREVAFVSELRIEFNSNGRRVRRLITQKEADELTRLIDACDWNGIDSFCYRIA